VLDRKAATSASCFGFDKPQAGLFIATASAGKNDDVNKLSRNLREYIEAAAKKGLTSELMERARAEEINAFIRVGNSHEIFSRVLSDAKSQAIGDWLLAARCCKAVTVDEANSSLRKWIVPTNRSDALRVMQKPRT